MAKISIKDPSVRIKPSEQLCSFIASLTDYNEMPENILKIYQIYSGDVSTTKKTISNKDIPKPNLTGNDINLLKKLNANEIGQDIKTALDALFDSDDDAEKDDDDNDENNIENLDSAKPLSKSQAKKLKEKQKLRTKSRLTINLNDLKWLNNVLIEKRKTNQFNVYLHELMVESKLILPKNEIQIRNPELEARCVRLRLEQDARMYNAMTKNVDSSRKQMPEDTVAYQMKQINRQLIAVAQFLFSVAAGFAFGFIGVELIIGNLDFGFRLLLGIICALVIALAEIYFLAKKLNEEFDLSTEELKLKPSIDSIDSNDSISQSPSLPPPIKVSGKEHKD